MSENLSALSGRKGLEENLFEKMVEKSKISGTPEDEELKALAEEYLMGKAITYGTASFYDFMKKEHKGVRVRVCNGSACLVAETQEKVRAKLSGYFSEEEIGQMCCLGRCHENSAFNYNEKNYSGDDIDRLDEIFNKPENALTDQYTVEASGERVLTDDPMTAEEYKELFSEVLKNGAEWALEQIKASKIRGRGGAGFPMGFKLNACRNEESDQKFIVCNADEGDPGAYSDRYLLEEQPMLVLFGMMTAGFIVGADHGAVYTRGEYPESVRAMTEAVLQLEKIGFHGDNILGSGFNYRFKIIEGAGAYICGEETALLSSLEGQRPEVRVRPPFPAQKGLFNKPTIVNNVETLAAVPWIVKQGGEKFARIGTAKSSGTKLVCLDSFFNNPGMYEVEMGSSFKELIYGLGGGFKEPVKAVHVGGPLGGIVPTHKIEDLTLDFESFANAGFLLGHAGIVSVPDKFPMIKYLEHLFEFTADESCGKCFPCSIGSVRGKEMIEKSRNGGPKMDRQLLDDLLETLEIGSLCALGGGLPLGINNALEYFDEELKAYFN
jgi:NADH-quinone oxidoreductase subunit F